MFRRPLIDIELSRIPLLEGLSSRELNTVAQLSTPIDLRAGSVLTREGEPGAEFIILMDGRVDVVQRGEVVATRFAGAHLGEIALLGDQPRTATLVTTTPVRARVASRQEFSGLLATVPNLSERLAVTMAERLAA
ncbi:MAG TPA: cyclic nucleotide-binding domain-containing protein [Acidimicrobiia bacterium]|nr:cyclic nucleotide-binding domain-containing protein [Acidimicrobiia bacterium]